MPINIQKKLEKLNKFVKKSNKHIYEWTFYSKHAVTADYKYQEIYRDIKIAIFEEFEKDCQIYNGGSRVMGLADDTESDLDFFVDIGNENYFKDRDFEKGTKIIQKFKASLEKRKPVWHVKNVNVRVPSFKVLHNETGIVCDISINNGMSAQNSKLFYHLFSIQTEAIAFHHFIRRWLKIFDVKVRGFSLTLLIVFFLQQHQLMPTIKQIQKKVPKIFLCGFEVQFDPTRTLDYYKINEMKDYKQWLKPFFRFYSKDIYRDNVICTYNGQIFEMKDYSVHINRSYPMTIAAPLLRHSNVAKSVKNTDIAAFCEACQFSYQYYDEYLH